MPARQRVEPIMHKSSNQQPAHDYKIKYTLVVHGRIVHGDNHVRISLIVIEKSTVCDNENHLLLDIYQYKRAYENNAIGYYAIWS